MKMEQSAFNLFLLLLSKTKSK